MLASRPRVGVGTSVPPRQIALPPDTEIRSSEWSPTGEWIAALQFTIGGTARQTLLINPTDGSIRTLPTLDSPTLAGSRDGKTGDGVRTIGAASELRAVDVAYGSVRTVARYDVALTQQDDINGALRLGLDPTGRSLVTTGFTNRSNLWMIRGLIPPRPWWEFWRRH